ncbi:MAG: CHAT domain-containing protein [Saprospiraceae bacterium]|nr:CHAT domain-containing protein [Saprospiraceae bacterium]
MFKNLLSLFLLVCICSFSTNGQAVTSIPSKEKEVFALVDTVLKLTDKRNFKDAFEFAEKSKAYAEQHLGKQSRGYARLLNAQGRNWVFQGKYEEAKTYFTHALSIYDQIDPNDKFVSLITTNIGLSFRNLNQFDQAEPFYIRSCKIRLDSFGEKSAQYAEGLNSLGLLALNQSNLNRAEQLLTQAVKIQEAIGANRNGKFANSLNNLALVYKELGEYALAEPLYAKATAIRKEVLGEVSVDYGTSLNNLSLFYNDLKNHEKALETVLKSVQIREKVLGRNHPDFAQSLLATGLILYESKEFQAAIDTLLSARQIYESLNLTKTESYFWVLTNLGLAEIGLKNKAEAQQYLNSAQQAAQEIYGEQSVFNAQAYLNLGFLYLNFNDYEHAMSAAARSVDLYRQTNPGNPLYLTAIFDYLQIAHKAHRQLDTTLAFLYLKKNMERHSLFATFLNETELSIAIKNELPLFDLLCSYLLKPTVNQDEIAKQVFEYQLFNKQFTLASSYAVNMLAKFKNDETTLDAYDRWKGFKKKLADAYSKNERDEQRITIYTHAADSLEKILVRTVKDFGEYRKPIGWREIQQSLEPGEAAVEFIRFELHSDRPNDSVLYAAFVVTPGGTSPVFVPLFEKNDMSSILTSLKGSNFNKINAIYNESKLYDLVWKPLETHLKGIKKLHCAPAGLLHRLNLSAIPVNTRQNYADRRNVILLGSVRQLVVENAAQTYTPTAYLAGGIQYTMDSAAMIHVGRNGSRGLIDEGIFEFEADSLLRGESWNYLPESTREVNEISSTLFKYNFQAQVDTGFVASEESFRSLGTNKSSPRIIHLSTHGYFFNDPAVLGNPRNQLEFQPPFKTSDHPLIRTGLILAGGNHAWSGKPTPEGLEDGILTAYEISQMNLSQTELVVLSACETGLGDIRGNEGVYGLQRAFKIAGVKYLIMSLWKVNDQTTRELMTEFYRQWLEQKQTIPDAFAAAQAHMRTKYPGAPFHWAGFVLVE